MTTTLPEPEYILIFETTDGSPCDLSQESRVGLQQHFRAALNGKKLQPSVIRVQGKNVVRIERVNPPTPSQMVQEFHETFGHPVLKEPTNQDWKTEDLRVSLIAEELSELEMALDLPRGSVEQDRARLVAIADALSDLEYVVHGAAHAWGIPLDDTTAEVHRSNMSKLGEDGKPIYREDGKVMKGPNFVEPDLAAILFPDDSEEE